jgi:hypothetical protein
MARTHAYVIFDGDEDKWAYAYMLGWDRNTNVDFEFDNAHDLDTMTSRASEEAYVKTRLRERMWKSSEVVAIVGAKTRNLFQFVRWELEQALDIGLPIIVANLNGMRDLDRERCPPILRDACAVHVYACSSKIARPISNAGCQGEDPGTETL